MYFFALIFILIVVGCINVYAKRDPVTRDQVTHEREFDREVCEPNEVFCLKTRIENDSAHSMGKVYLKQVFDEAFELYEEPKYKVKKEDKTKLITCKTHVRGNRTQEITTRLRISRRGVYKVGRLELDCLDTLGFHSASYKSKQVDKIVVTPKRVENSFLSSLITSGYGDFNAKRGFIEDETSVSTYAEYTGKEPMRQISWKKTAQEGTLMVKQFEPMGAHVTTVVFDVTDFTIAEYGSRNYELVEYCISMLREMFEYFEQKRISYRFYTNAQSSYLTDYAFTSTSSGRATRTKMLCMLGELNYNIQSAFFTKSDKLLDYAIRNSFKAPFIYLAPVHGAKINFRLKKLSKVKGIEIIELYAEQYCKLKKKETNQ